MKVYNKKGLLWGLFWTVLGLFSLYRAFVDPDSFWLQQVKSVVIAAVVLLSLLAYLLTENLGWDFLFVTSSVLAGISILVELIAFLYYERRE